MLRRVITALGVALLVGVDSAISPLDAAEFSAASPATVGERIAVALPTPLVSDGAMLPIVVLVLVLLGLGGVAWYTGIVSWPGDEDGGSTIEAPPTPDEPEVETATPETAGETSGGTQQELLSDEDLVIQLLEENGGRMKQVTIVEQTDWSKSKVSMLLSEMEENDQISKLRVGRENIISLAGQEPDAAGSPFESE